MISPALTEARPGARCPYGACDGSGIVDDLESNTSYDCRCRPQVRARARTRQLRHHVPARYRHLGWDRHPLPAIEAENPRPVAAVKRYCRAIEERVRSGRGLWLLGTKGTGKTTLGYMVASAAVEARLTVGSFNGVTLLNRIRDTYAANARESTSGLIDALTAVDLLHVEDLRVVRPTDWVLEQLYLIVNTRYEERRPIVFTSDVTPGDDGTLHVNPNELAEHVGPRTFSRLIEICGDPLVITGRDHRLDAGVELDD